MNIKTLLLLTCATVAGMPLSCGSEPVYSLDVLQHHPYRFVPAFGHASQNPGSPRWFVPGYGYQIPGFGYSLQRYRNLNLYNANYAFGQRVPGNYSNATHRYWSHSSVAVPWYQPGSPFTTRARFNW